MTVSVREAARRTGEFFMGESPVEKAVVSICTRLNELKIPYALAGGMAVNRYDVKRNTEDVGIVIDRAGLQRFKDECLGRGWVENFSGSKVLRDATNKVKIDFLLTDETPGDGKSVPFKFPNPNDASETDEDGISVLTLPRLLDLKLASGMTVPKKPRDFDDAMRLIEANKLPRDYGSKLHPFVRAKYDELWLIAQTSDPKPEA
jgi:hypothetical protein